MTETLDLDMADVMVEFGDVGDSNNVMDPHLTSVMSSEEKENADTGAPQEVSMAHVDFSDVLSSQPRPQRDIQLDTQLHIQPAVPVIDMAAQLSVSEENCRKVTQRSDDSNRSKSYETAVPLTAYDSDQDEAQDEAKDEPQDELQDEPQDEPKDDTKYEAQDELQDEPQDGPKDEPQNEPWDEPNVSQDEPKNEPQDEPKNEPNESQDESKNEPLDEPQDEPRDTQLDESQPANVDDIELDLGQSSSEVIDLFSLNLGASDLTFYSVKTDSEASVLSDADDRPSSDTVPKFTQSAPEALSPVSATVSAPMSPPKSPPKSPIMSPVPSVPLSPPTSVPISPPTSVPISPTPSVPMSPPNSVPVSPPTLVPISPPTSVPISPPSSVPMSPPNSVPVSPPTLVPISPPKSPTLSPVTSPTMSPPKSPTISPVTSPPKSPTKSPVTSPPMSPPMSPPKSPFEAVKTQSDAASPPAKDVTCYAVTNCDVTTQEADDEFDFDLPSREIPKLPTEDEEGEFDFDFGTPQPAPVTVSEQALQPLVVTPPDDKAVLSDNKPVPAYAKYLPAGAKAVSATDKTTPAAVIPPVKDVIEVKVDEEPVVAGDGGEPVGGEPVSAVDEWSQVATVTPRVVQGEQRTLSVQPQTQKPLVTYGQFIQHCEQANWQRHKDSIQPTVQYRGFKWLKNLLFGPPKLQPSLHTERDLVFCLAATPLDSSDPLHTRALQTLHRKLTGSKFDPPRYGSHWEEIGFQGNDPATDFRSVGVLGLLQLLYLVTNGKTAALARDIHKLSQDELQNFPFCVMGINLSRVVLQTLRSGHLNKECNRAGSVLTEVCELYAAVYYDLYTVWRTRRKTILDTGPVIRDIELRAKKKSKFLRDNLKSRLEQKTLNEVGVGGGSGGEVNFMDVCAED